MNLSVVIPVFNQAHFTEICLQSLLDHSSHPIEVFVVDNGSTDHTEQVLEAFQKKFEAVRSPMKVIRNLNNLGFGRACNQGLREARGDYVAVLNNDTWLMPQWETAMISKMRAHGLDCIGPYFFEGEFQPNRMKELAQKFISRNQNALRNHFVPILMLFSKAALESLRLEHRGIFDERFFVTFEDTDLRERMVRQGLHYGQTGASFIWHHSRGTRNEPKLLASGYEQEGLRLFIEKWNFDPRPREHTLKAKLRRTLWRFKEKYGWF